ncbi:hypothetical protein [Cohnella nanjingensis]|uniref:DUF3221 domain-containing protein n=1 Tax=Cohnella nanjingensis TaxID=1387779 RepID=A0A7X0RW76_9BACL|nr:hypothetical protein [Cohnella nanjingensis]MBB6674788.1 hypothetical protein [Cohnella nanjingensis]
MLNNLNRYGKNSAWAVAVLTMLLMGTGCSDNGNKSTNASPSASASATASASASASSEPTPSASASDSASPPAGTETKEDTGEYTGLGDTHSIEIKTSEGPTTFQVDPDIVDKVSDWAEGTKVKFKYEITSVEGDASQKQRTIISIDKA